MRLFTLTSDLHGELAQNAHNEQFIKDIEAAIGQGFDYCGPDFSDYGAAGDIIYVRTGGTEGIFRQVFEGHEGARVRLLTSGQSNSLAASMEILSWLRQQDLDGEIIHGSIDEIASGLLRYYPRTTLRRSPLVQPFADFGILDGRRYGIVGRPSDWLISSNVDYGKVREVFGATLVDIPIEELLHATAQVKDPQAAGLKPMNIPKYGRPISEEDFNGSLYIYEALKALIAKYRLDGLTLRCFDLLTALHNTGCLALARLNAEGFTATCEGDIPALLSMAVARERSGRSGFQANLSSIRGDEFIFAHCTVPLDMTRDWCYDTHFESGIGVAVHGELAEGSVRIFKIGADLEHCIDVPAELHRNTYEDNICRTQIVIKGDGGLRHYFLHEPLGNHHIICF